MGEVLSTIGKLNYSYACANGPRRISRRAQRTAQAIAHGFGLSIEPTRGETLRFSDPSGTVYLFGQLNRGAGFTCE